jgi:hypothetical protein
MKTLTKKIKKFGKNFFNLDFPKKSKVEYRIAILLSMVFASVWLWLFWNNFGTIQTGAEGFKCLWQFMIGIVSIVWSIGLMHNRYLKTGKPSFILVILGALATIFD